MSYYLHHFSLFQQLLAGYLASHPIKGMSIYSLASRTLIPGEWGGEEVLLFLRYEWSLNVTVLHPTFEYKLGHNMSVKNSHLVLAHNGQDHYMPCGKTCK